MFEELSTILFPFFLSLPLFSQLGPNPIMTSYVRKRDTTAGSLWHPAKCADAQLSNTT